MFARPSAHHSQIAYVTNDLEAAVALFKEQFGAPGFFVFSNTQSATGGMELKIGLARVGGVEIELIEPLSNTARIFKDVLPSGPGLAVRFHHVANRIGGSIEEWLAYARSIDKGAHPVVFEGALGDDLRFFYTDERLFVGHYVEHVWMSAELLSQLETAVPKFPS